MQKNETLNLRFNMKKVIQVIGMIFTIVIVGCAKKTELITPEMSAKVIEKVSAETLPADNDAYLTNNILPSVKDISISKLLDFRTISAAINDEFDKARFHYIIAHEINNRLNDLDEKFNADEKKYRKEIGRYEDELDITPYKYTNDRPRFDYTYQAAKITDETIYNDIHRIQADLARTQFIQVYKYYRKRIDNYKNYITTLKELHTCKTIENKDNKVEFYSNFPEMHQGIKLLHDAKDDAGKMRVHRNVLGKVLYIDWNEEDEVDNSRRRNFEYFNNGTVSKLTDTIEDEVVFETLFGENDMAENFINYIFTEGFIPRDYSYFTEVYYNNGKASAYKFTTMNDHVIGTIYREFDEKDHLIKEAWCKGNTSEILREFSSIFDESAGGYKLIERDRNGVIVHQEIILSSND